MATYSMGDLKKGLKIELDGKPYKIVEYQHVKPGKGAAFVRVKIKSFIDGKVLEKTFHAGDKCEAPNLVEKEMQYLYDDGEYCQFMDVESYEQVAIADEDTPVCEVLLSSVLRVFFTEAGRVVYASLKGSVHPTRAICMFSLPAWLRCW